VIRPLYRDDLATLVRGDALVVLSALPDRSVDALVTDPPAGIAFMGRDWDTFPVRWRAGATFADGRARPGLIAGQEHRAGARDAYVLWLAKVMSEGRRVLKPGAHALVWSIPRTSHWVAAALEEAGFEIRDAVHHLFGQGFPKSRSLGDVGHPELGTGLKPAVEVWWLARVPMSEANVEANVLRHGTGALSIDACRVPAGADHAVKCASVVGLASNRHANTYRGYVAARADSFNAAGRWPANLVLSHAEGCVQVGTRLVPAGTAIRRRGVAGGRVYSEGRWAHPAGTSDMGYADARGIEAMEAWDCVEGCPVAELDRQSGEGLSRVGRARAGLSGEGWGMTAGGTEHTDAGGASRFFYVAKASTADRNAGLVWGRNRHPTVKPVELMRYLVRLVTPPGGLVLDCFAGSGSTLVAAKLEGFRSIGIERDRESVETCVRRLRWAVHQPRLVEVDAMP
jgi:site-specific DNA-methyltransferase (adenine-specific)